MKVACTSWAETQEKMTKLKVSSRVEDTYGGQSPNKASTAEGESTQTHPLCLEASYFLLHFTC